MGYDGVLYHENQIAGLCGLHCINTLLQGPVFNEIDLMHIAQEVDRKEREVMSEGGLESEDYKKFIEEGSHNVSLDGNFNVEVLSEALAVWDLKVVRLGSSEDTNRNPLLEEAFICNLAAHWLTVRKVEGSWFNFNSVFRAPEPLSEFYLSVFLDSLQAEGYSIFIVKGRLPPPQPIDPTSPNWKLPQIRVSNTGRAQVDPAQDPELARAIAESLRTAGYEDEIGQSQGSAMDVDNDLERAIQLSLLESQGSTQHNIAPQTLPKPATPTTVISTSTVNNAAVEEEERRAIAMSYEASLPPEPEPGPETVTFALRLPSGARLQRRFHKNSPWQQVYDFLGSRGLDPQSHVVYSQMPRKALPVSTEPISTSELGSSAALVVEPIQPSNGNIR